MAKRLAGKKLIPEPAPRQVRVQAYDVVTSFDLVDLVQRAASWGKVVCTNPLIVELPSYRYVAIFDYGALVFFNFAAQEARPWIESLKTYGQRANGREYSDEFMVFIGSEGNLPSTEALHVRRYLLDVVKLVAIVLSRSVSLEYYEDLVSKNVDRLANRVEALAHTGKLTLRRRALVREVGVALAVQTELAHNLGLLDEPDVLWEGGSEMQQLYDGLYREFAIRDRAQVLERKLRIASQAGEFIIGQLQDRTANLLEWGIIALFVIDLVLIFVLAK